MLQEVKVKNPKNGEIRKDTNATLSKFPKVYGLSKLVK